MRHKEKERDVIMRQDITLEAKQKLIPMYQKVEEDFNKFPEIRTTEDFFAWRDNIKKEIEQELIKAQKVCDDDTKKAMRNKRVEEAIAGNESLEMLYTWTKFDRMITSTKALIRTVNDKYGIEDSDHVLKASDVLHNYLVNHNKINTDNLFNLFQIPELNLLVKYQYYEFKPITTRFEFENLIFKQDESPWPAPLFIAALKAYGIETEDLLVMGREFSALGDIYIDEVNSQYGNGTDEVKKYVYAIRQNGDNN